MEKLNYISDVEDSLNPMIIEIKNLVNEYLSINFINCGVFVSFMDRDKAVWKTYKTFYKKYNNDSRYLEKPTFILKQIINSYYSV